MKAQISKIQKINSLIGNKNYRKAFYTIYDIVIDGNHDFDNIIDPLLASDRCNGDFYHACRVYEDMISAEEAKIETAKKSKKVKDFIANYKNWTSGYAMGERVIIVFKTEHRSQCVTIANNEQYYDGRGRKFNRNIKHGIARLDVDLTGSRAKYEINTLEK